MARTARWIVWNGGNVQLSIRQIDDGGRRRHRDYERRRVRTAGAFRARLRAIAGRMVLRSLPARFELPAERMARRGAERAADAAG